MCRVFYAVPHNHAIVCDIDTHYSGSDSCFLLPFFYMVLQWNWPTRLEETITRSLWMPP
jgi:hypothetical protein